MKVIRVRKIAPNLIEIDPVILEENTKFRRLFVGQLAKDSEGVWQVRGTFTVERRGKDKWHLVEGVSSIARLKAGDMAKLELRTEHMKHLFTGLHVLADAAENEGVTLRSADLVIGKKDEIVRIVGHQHRAVIEQLIAQRHGSDFWSALTSLEPDLATRLVDSSIQSKRRAALSIFESELERKLWTEPEWEDFFVKNQWILGYGLRYQFLGLVENQANYGGVQLTGKGTQRGEFLMATRADKRFTVLVEIKRPDTPIFHDRSESHPFRRGVPGFSAEFVNAISQVQTNSRTWETEGSRREDDREALSREGIHTISPRSILILGHTSQLSHSEKTKAFQLFRSHLNGTDILTFDELLQRARFIVEEATERGV
jgi:hypothetical protein